MPVLAIPNKGLILHPLFFIGKFFFPRIFDEKCPIESGHRNQTVVD